MIILPVLPGSTIQYLTPDLTKTAGWQALYGVGKAPQQSLFKTWEYSPQQTGYTRGGVDDYDHDHDLVQVLQAA